MSETSLGKSSATALRSLVALGHGAALLREYDSFAAEVARELPKEMATRDEVVAAARFLSSVSRNWLPTHPDMASRQRCSLWRNSQSSA
jgi:hypothetical protein